jgi:polar amino acid transport system substrate-binding protein
VKIFGIFATAALAACLFVVAGASAGSSACTPKHQIKKTVNAGYLTVAAYEFPPYIAIKGNVLTGADGDVVMAIAAAECLKVKVLPGVAAAVIPAVQTGRADIGVGDWYRTKARAKVVLQSAPVYLDQMAFASKSGLNDVQGVKGKNVGSMAGVLWIEDLQKVLGDSLKTYQAADGPYQDLANGRLDVVVDSVVAAKQRLGQKPIDGVVVKVVKPDAAVGASLHPGQSNFPGNKNNAGLTTAINADIAALRKAGTLAKILSKNSMDPSAANVGAPYML